MEYTLNIFDFVLNSHTLKFDFSESFHEEKLFNSITELIEYNVRGNCCGICIQASNKTFFIFHSTTNVVLLYNLKNKQLSTNVTFFLRPNIFHEINSLKYNYLPIIISTIENKRVELVSLKYSCSAYLIYGFINDRIWYVFQDPVWSTLPARIKVSDPLTFVNRNTNDERGCLNSIEKINSLYFDVKYTSADSFVRMNSIFKKRVLIYRVSQPPLIIDSIKLYSKLKTCWLYPALFYSSENFKNSVKYKNQKYIYDDKHSF
jgi:hypothetical protein